VLSRERSERVVKFLKPLRAIAISHVPMENGLTGNRMRTRARKFSYAGGLLKNPKIAIIILNWNGKHDTLACLESLEQLTYPHFEVIVVDNGSSDDSSSLIRKRFPQHLLIENGDNLGFAEGCNVGMREAMERGAGLFFLLNNDTVVAPDILERFVEMSHSHPEAGILGARIYLFDQTQTLDHLGGLWNRKTGTFELVGKQQQDTEPDSNLQELDYVCGAGLIVKRKVIETIGYLDPRFFLIWEESDYCFRASRAGFKILTCPHAKLWHKVSASFVGGKPHSTYFWWRNRLLWIEKNCSPYEKTSLYFHILIPDILHMLKIQLIKTVQLSFTKKFRRKINIKEKNEKLLKNRAALCGVRDYMVRRFGKGPDWLHMIK
ncbi:MAG: glycosyltransferase family 2 protein, partial [Rhabdochlamydiaceae bacterium]